jgi:alpha-mannosidase
MDDRNGACETLNADYATFIWLAGLGSAPGIASFDLFVNEEYKFTFWADGSDRWTLTADDGSSLTFQKDLVDEHGDRFGFMFLRIPVSNLRSRRGFKTKKLPAVNSGIPHGV